MSLSPEVRGRLIEIIIRVPASYLLDVVDYQNVIDDFETLRKQITDEIPEVARRTIIGAVIDRYDKSGSIAVLCGALANRLNGQLREELDDFTIDPGDDAAKQQATAKRANTFSNRDFLKFIGDTQPKICVVFAVDGRTGNPPVLGTGFLIGPDRVLTTYHTLKNHINPPDPANGRPGFSIRPWHPQDQLFAIFDHFSGPPITDSLPPDDEALNVKFSADWLLCCCMDMPNDGLFARPTPPQLQLLPNCLDFALIRISRPLGSMLRTDASGLNREWVNLKEATNSLRDQDGIVILQHPDGHAQRFGHGYYSERLSRLDSSYTRLRYTTPANPGSSGSPCFNQHFRLVGLHNARFDPGRKKSALGSRHNQAIRADRIRDTIEKRAKSTIEDTDSILTFWNAAVEATQPEPILRRRALLKWIDEGRQDTRGRAQRVYAAMADVERAGRTFSTDILFAVLRDRSDIVVPLGNREQLPATVADFVRIVGYLLRIPESVLAGLPPRPDSTHPGGADGDKLRKWASEEVPNWLAKVLAAHRETQYDRRIPAQRSLQELRKAGINEVPADLRAIAESKVPLMAVESNWDRVWIVLDRIEGGNLNDEVKDLIAGLIGVTLEESRVNRELARIRWLFLGFAPDFLATGDVSAEKLDPADFGENDVIECVGKMLKRAGKPFSMDQEGAIVRSLIDPMMDARRPDLDDPKKKLQTLQDITRRLIAALADLMGLNASEARETVQ